MSKSLKNTLLGREDKNIKKNTNAASDQTAFMIEALLLLMCLMMVIAVSVTVISTAVKTNNHYAHEEAAITLATGLAERFSAAPTSMDAKYVQDDLVASCNVVTKENNAGTLYDATISVTRYGEQVWHVSTSRYVPNENGGAA